MEFLVSLCFLRLALSSPEYANDKPNLVFIMADDVGYADVGFTHSLFPDHENTENFNVPTPHLDRLAKQGVVISQYYTHSTCTPSRASFLTGRYAGNTGLNALDMRPRKQNATICALCTRACTYYIQRV
jgi:arylsulfatase A-like enzyme